MDHPSLADMLIAPAHLAEVLSRGSRGPRRQPPEGFAMARPPTPDRLAAAARAATRRDSARDQLASPEQVVGQGLGCKLVLAGSAAVLSVSGPMMGNPVDAWWLGGCADDHLVALLDAAAQSPAKAVLLVVDSPGGTVAGSDDVNAAARRLAATGKTVATVARHLLCSKAYWMACNLRRDNQPARIYATPDACVGSIGAMTTLVDVRAMYEKIGIKVQNVTSGAMKDAGDPHRGIDEAVLEDARARVALVADRFFADAAAATGLPEQQIRDLEAQVFYGPEAEKRGIVSRCAGYAGVLVEATEGGDAWTVSAPDPTPSQDPTQGGSIDEPYPDPSEDEPMDLKTLTEKHPDLVASIRNAAVAEHKAASSPQPATVADLRAAFPGQDTFALDCLAKNLTLDQAKAAHYEILKADVASLKKSLADHEAREKALASAGGEGREAVGKVPSVQQPDDDPSRAKAYKARVDENVAKGMSLDKAIGKVNREHPELAQAFRAVGKPLASL